MDRDDAADALLDSVTTGLRKAFEVTLDLRADVDRDSPYPRVRGQMVGLIKPPSQQRQQHVPTAVQSTFDFTGPNAVGGCTTSTSARLWTANGWKEVHSATVRLNNSPDWVEPVLKVAQLAATIAHHSAGSGRQP